MVDNLDDAQRERLDDLLRSLGHTLGDVARVTVETWDTTQRTYLALDLPTKKES